MSILSHFSRLILAGGLLVCAGPAYLRLLSACATFAALVFAAGSTRAAAASMPTSAYLLVHFDKPGRGGYFPIVITNFDDPRGFKVLPADAYSFGVGEKRHGGILNITRSELAALRAKWPSRPATATQRSVP